MKEKEEAEENKCNNFIFQNLQAEPGWWNNSGTEGGGGGAQYYVLELGYNRISVFYIRDPQTHTHTHRLSQIY